MEDDLNELLRDRMIYCPVCSRHIAPKIEQNDDKSISIIYVHSDIVHSESDIEALQHSIQ